MQLIILRFPSLNSSRQTDRRQHQHRILLGVRFHLPALVADFQDATDDDVTDFTGVTSTEGSDADELVDAFNYACD